MERLESSGVRPRQARYQAALRPDMNYLSDSTVFLYSRSSGRSSDRELTAYESAKMVLELSEPHHALRH